MRVLLFLFCVSAGQLIGRPEPTNALLEEMRMALLDAKQSLNSQKLETALLEEKIGKLEKDAIASPLERRLSTLEKNQDKLMSDVRSLSQYAKELATTIGNLSEQLNVFNLRLNRESQRLNEVSQLRSTIHSLTKAMESSAQSSHKVHRVRAGDSLEKIARLYQISVEEIKHGNGLTHNKILIGQELKIPQ